VDRVTAERQDRVPPTARHGARRGPAVHAPGPRGRNVDVRKGSDGRGRPSSRTRQGCRAARSRRRSHTRRASTSRAPPSVHEPEIPAPGGLAPPWSRRCSRFRRSSASTEGQIPAGNRLTDYRAARSALPAVGLDLAGSSRQSGKTGVDWRESRASLRLQPWLPRSLLGQPPARSPSAPILHGKRDAVQVEKRTSNRCQGPHSRTFGLRAQPLAPLVRDQVHENPSLKLLRIVDPPVQDE